MFSSLTCYCPNVAQAAGHEGDQDQPPIFAPSAEKFSPEDRIQAISYYNSVKLKEFPNSLSGRENIFQLYLFKAQITSAIAKSEIALKDAQAAEKEIGSILTPYMKDRDKQAFISALGKLVLDREASSLKAVLQTAKKELEQTKDIAMKMRLDTREEKGLLIALVMSRTKDTFKAEQDLAKFNGNREKRLSEFAKDNAQKANRKAFELGDLRDRLAASISEVQAQLDGNAPENLGWRRRLSAIEAAIAGRLEEELKGALKR